MFGLSDEEVDIPAAEAELAEPVEVFDDQPQIPVQAGHRFVKSGLGERLRMRGAGCNLVSSHAQRNARQYLVDVQD
jgi:hypothetical protein